MQAPQVIVVGGAPGAGKSMLGAAIARRLGCLSSSMDDLYVAVQAVTSPDSHPALHCMRRVPSADYFTFTPPAQLIADAAAQHEALWPAIEKVIRVHAANGPSLVLDGWFVTPGRLHGLGLANVRAVWLVTSREVLLAREQANLEFFGKSADPPRMLDNFLARSVWHDARIRADARALDVPVLLQDGSLSPEALCDAVIAPA